MSQLLVRRRGPVPAAVIVATVIVAAAAALAGCSGSSGHKTSSPSTAAGGTARAGALPPAADTGIPAVVARVSPSVVTILTGSGLGSGVVWAADGTIVTDDHVVSGNQQVTIAFAGGMWL